jgi:aryl-alcohol dehydrogenase-like predicted oxidoreductase
MRYRTFGATGWQVSEIGFGAWEIGGGWGPQDDRDSLAALHRALDLGINLIDTAEGYGGGHSERLIGQMLKERGLSGGGGPVHVATKFGGLRGHWPPFPDDVCEERYPADYLRQAAESSLRNLNAEVLDVALLHTWTRAWNRNPVALETMHELKQEGKILAVGISTPEHDQNALIDLVRSGWLDAVEVIYNIFEQEPRAEFLPTMQEHNVGVIVRVALDEGSLTGTFSPDMNFPKGDWRAKHYFKGDRLAETIRRVKAIRETMLSVSTGTETDMVSVALRFVLRHPAVSTVLTGVRNVAEVEHNCAVSDQPPLSDELYEALKEHNWRRAFLEE